MNHRFVGRLAYREGRSALRQVGLYLLSIALGVAALVALQGLRSDLERTIRAEARTLLGADLRLESQLPFPDEVLAAVDSLALRTDVRRVGVTIVGTVIRSENGESRFVQLRALDGPYPLYGSSLTDPAGGWDRMAEGVGFLSDPPVPLQLAVDVGDSLQVGELRLPLLGVAPDLPPEVAFQGALGPRVYLSAEALDQSGLLAFGSLVRHQILLAASDPGWADAVQERLDPLFRQHLVSSRTASRQAEFLSGSVESFARFLGLVGLLGLLLGGIGVASAVHVYVRSRVESVAVLRCLGAQPAELVMAYLLQAVALGLLGSGAGVGLGVLIQWTTPALLAAWLPLPLEPSLDWGAMGVGLLMGSWVAGVFSLLPVLRVREVSPLRALREAHGPTEEGHRRLGVRVGVGILLLMSLVTLSIWQAPTVGIGAAFAGGTLVILLTLVLAAHGVMVVTRGWGGRRLPFGLRFGVTSLSRPGNQTLAVMIALGFGTALLSAILVTERSLLDSFRMEASEGQPDLLLFDIQPDQVLATRDLLTRAGATRVELTPIVPARLEAVAGRRVSDLVDSDRAERPPNWVLRRVYRNSYRAELTASEQLLEGKWWSDGSDAADPEGLPGVSLEEELARDLRVGVGDRIVWDVQGVPIETRVASIRRVDWARFELNFFAVFEPGVLDDAPRTYIALGVSPGSAERRDLERSLATGFPNVSMMDLAAVRDVIDRILDRLALGIQLLAVFALSIGFLVLLASVGTSRGHRRREAALLRTLGARSAILRMAMGAEYFLLGLASGMVGVGSGAVTGWALAVGVFEVPVSIPPGSLFLLVAGLATTTTIAGIAFTRRVSTTAPLATLRLGAG